MFSRFKNSIPIAALAVSLVSFSSPLQAAIEPAGNVILTSGPFVAIQSDRSARSLARGSEFYQGDRLWTGPRTRAQIRFSDGAIMTLRPDTEFSVDEYEFDDKNTSRNTSLFTLIKGGFRTITGLIARLRPNGYKIKTSYAIVGVRGTTVEAVIENGAFYVGAWQGTVSVNTNKDELLLGFGQDFNFARVTSINGAPKGLVQTPPQFQLNLDPNLQEGVVDPTQTRLVSGLLEDGIDPRLTQAEVASLNQLGFATFGGSQLSAAASDGSTGSPIFFDVRADAVLRQGSAPLTNGPNTLVGVSWGVWNGTISPATIQPDAANPSLTVPVNSEVFWITMVPPPSMPATGLVPYTLAGGAASGSGAGGAVTSFNATVDFGSAALTGSMVVTDSPNIWNANFTGTINNATFNASLNPSSTVNVINPATGTVQGGFSGTGANTMGGVFGFQEVGTSTTFVNGVFVAQ